MVENSAVSSLWWLVFVLGAAVVAAIALLVRPRDCGSLFYRPFRGKPAPKPQPRLFQDPPQ